MSSDILAIHHACPLMLMSSAFHVSLTCLWKKNVYLAKTQRTPRTALKWKRARTQGISQRPLRLVRVITSERENKACVSRRVGKLTASHVSSSEFGTKCQTSALGGVRM